MKKTLILSVALFLYLSENSIAQNTYPWPSTGNIVIENNANTATSLQVRNSTSGADAWATVGTVGQNQRALVLSTSDAMTRPYPGFHSASNSFWGSGTNGLNIISDGSASGVTGPNTGLIRFITHSASGGVTSEISNNDAATRMIITASGNVLIGKLSQTNTAYKLDINGQVRANEIKVNTTGADFVFEDKYKLKSLPEIENFIKTNRHLPDILPATEMKKEGMAVGEMQTKLLQKIEELTLYLIEQNKTIEQQQKNIRALEGDIQQLKKFK